MTKGDSPEHADAAERARASLRVVARNDVGRPARSHRDDGQDREQVLRDGAGFYVMSASGAVSVDADHGRPIDGAAGAALGISVIQRSPDLSSRLRTDAPGLVVLTVAPHSYAARAGLRPGDIIEQVNRQPLDSIATLRQAVSAIGIAPLLLQVVRRDTRFFITANVW